MHDLDGRGSSSPSPRLPHPRLPLLFSPRPQVTRARIMLWLLSQDLLYVVVLESCAVLLAGLVLVIYVLGLRVIWKEVKRLPPYDWIWFHLCYILSLRSCVVLLSWRLGRESLIKARFSKHLQWPPNAFAPNEKGAWDLMLLPLTLLWISQTCLVAFVVVERVSWILCKSLSCLRIGYLWNYYSRSFKKPANKRLERRRTFCKTKQREKVLHISTDGCSLYHCVHGGSTAIKRKGIRISCKFTRPSFVQKDDALCG